ncbi:MAG: HEPN domain-containing protein [Gemmatimonadota bacterium]
MSDPDHARLLLEAARKDLRALEAMRDPSAFAEEIFGFHAQQAVEKAIKAWLSLLGLAYPRTHDLEALVALLDEGGETVPEAWAELIDLSDFAVQLRYEAYEYDEEPLDRPVLVRRVESVIERVGREVAGTVS